MRTILVSVWDKTGLKEFLSDLKKSDELTIISTGGTSKYLEENGFQCLHVEDLTKFPEILGGRVKTLHPKVFAGILARPTAEDRKCLKEHEIPEIDFVVVNLYPFEKKLKEDLTEAQMIEFIDIGGVSLLRAAGKCFERVGVICEPDQYESVVKELERNKGQLDVRFKKALALQAFERTAAYDSQISNYFSHQLSEEKEGKVNLPPSINLRLAQFQELRYGENPHQAAVWYSDGRFSPSQTGLDFPPFQQLQGKELSSNNITDTYCLARILREIGSPGACIIKHNNPCGVAVGKTIDEAFDKAYNTDPLSAFGGIYGFTDTVNETLAKKIVEGFVEIVAAPDFNESALEIFKSKKNIRVLRLKKSVFQQPQATSWHVRDLQDFGWIIERDVEPPVQLAQFQCVTGGLKPEKIADASFAWGVVKHLTSNAIFIVKDGRSLGFGIGQTSRISSVKIALEQAGDDAHGAVMASDAFFPATDNIDEAARAGISVIVQPGGSVKDKEVIAACEKAGITMLFTGQRCFKH